MKVDEFAFVNQQLAAMLKDGIPLEGALRQLCQSMQRGELKTELQQVEAKLAQGIPLKDVLASSKLPEFYVRMIQVGIASNNLPGVLTLLADYYHKAGMLWTRLKGLMVYPLIVLTTSVMLSVGLSLLFGKFLGGLGSELLAPGNMPVAVPFCLWVPPIILTLVLAAVVTAFTASPVRRRLSWRLPAFQDANLAKFSSAMTLMLQGGCSLADAIALLRQLEDGTPAGEELGRWQAQLAAGQTQVPTLTPGRSLFPPLYVWLVQSAGENPTIGFRRAGELYQARAIYRIDMLLYAALPVSVIFLGGFILSQAFGLFLPMITIIGVLGG